MPDGLPNRAAFLDRLDLAFARAKRGANPFAIHYLDLDRFKDVNDTLGHPVGDRLLQAVAERLKACVRETDMVARFGGDEFAVLQDEIDRRGGAEALAVKIGHASPLLSRSTAISSRPRQHRGRALCGDIEGAEAMMMKADLALYRAKDQGRNQCRLHVAELDQQSMSG